MQRGESDPTSITITPPAGLPLTRLNSAKPRQSFFTVRGPPVFVITNQQTGAREIPLLSRPETQRPPEASGWVTTWTSFLTGLGTTNFQMGDPEWIGVLERPTPPMGTNNKFSLPLRLHRPAGRDALDLNYIIIRPDLCVKFRNTTDFPQ